MGQGAHQFLTVIGDNQRISFWLSLGTTSTSVFDCHWQSMKNWVWMKHLAF